MKRKGLERDCKKQGKLGFGIVEEEKFIRSLFLALSAVSVQSFPEVIIHERSTRSSHEYRPRKKEMLVDASLRSPLTLPPTSHCRRPPFRPLVKSDLNSSKPRQPVNPLSRHFPSPSSPSLPAAQHKVPTPYPQPYSLYLDTAQVYGHRGLDCRLGILGLRRWTGDAL